SSSPNASSSSAKPTSTGSSSRQRPLTRAKRRRRLAESISTPAPSSRSVPGRRTRCASTSTTPTTPHPIGWSPHVTRNSWPRPSTAERLRPPAAEQPTPGAEQPGRDRLRPRTELRARRIVGRAVLWGKRSDSACTVRADGDAALFARKLRPMPDQEALHAGELIVLFGQDANGELFVRQVGTRQLEAFGHRGLILVDLARLRLRTLSLE